MLLPASTSLVLLPLLISSAQGQSRPRPLKKSDQQLLNTLLQQHVEEAADQQRSYGGSVTSKIPFRKWTHQSGQFLPTCAPQQVCNTVYPRLQRSNPQCVCPRGAPRCSQLMLSSDGHSVDLVTNTSMGALTTVKTCEANTEIRQCGTDDDWALLAVQNSRTGRAHYLVICRCPDDGKLAGPVQHAQPHYAHVPTIRIYGMLCRRRPVKKHHKHHKHHYYHRH